MPKNGHRGRQRIELQWDFALTPYDPYAYARASVRRGSKLGGTGSDMTQVAVLLWAGTGARNQAPLQTQAITTCYESKMVEGVGFEPT